MCVEGPSCDPGRLAGLLRAGDVAALEHLCRCHQEHLLSVGRRHCRTEEDARDAVQDALAAVGERPDAWRGDGPAVAWVARMVAHACHRRCRGGKNDPSRHASDVELAGTDDPEAAAASREEAERLERVLAAVGAEDRAILLLADAEGWSGPEIAEATGLRADAVRARLSRARRRVREALEGE